MTPISRQLNKTKLKMVELIEELSSFFKLIVLTLVESLYIYIFIKVHQPFDAYREHSPWCPMKIAILTIGFSLLFLNALIVIAFVATQTLAIMRNLKASFVRKDQGPGGAKVISSGARKSLPNTLNICHAGPSNVTVSLTVAGGSKDSGIQPERLPRLIGDMRSQKTA